MSKKGKFIVFYGINNLGKSTQAKELTKRLNNYNYKTEYIKYPIYELYPSGNLINDYLRNKNPYSLSTREIQIIYALNRSQYEKILLDKLNNGINIISEDYTGTGIAWGIGNNVSEKFLKEINSFLIKEDLAILFEGDRFRNAIEKKHLNENNDELIENVRKIHLDLAKEYNWIKIDANQEIDFISNQLFDIITNFINDSDSKLNKTYSKNILPKNNSIFASTLKSIDASDDNLNISNSSLKLFFEKISEQAKAPTKAYQDDAGFDLYSSDYYSISPNCKTTIQTGIKLEIPKGYVGLIWDKGGISKNGIKTSGGVIDSNYRGEIKINLLNLSNDIFNISPKQKIAQILIQKIESPQLIEKKIIEDTERGTLSFGSSGDF